MKTEQKDVDEWIKKHGVRYFNVLTNTVLLMEELGELSRYIARQYGEQSFKDPTQKMNVNLNIREEIGDVLFVLICLANQLNIDLDEALKETIEKKTKRDYKRHLENEKLK